MRKVSLFQPFYPQFGVKPDFKILIVQQGTQGIHYPGVTCLNAGDYCIAQDIAIHVGVCCYFLNTIRMRTTSSVVP